MLGPLYQELSRPMLRPSSYRRESRRRDLADRRTIRSRGPAMPSSLWIPRTQRRPTVAAPVSSRGIWGTLPFPYRKAALRTGDDISGRCIRRWAWATPDQSPLESICGEFANLRFCRWGVGKRRPLGRPRAFPRAAVAERRPCADHCQLPFAAENSFASGGRALG